MKQKQYGVSHNKPASDCFTRLLQMLSYGLLLCASEAFAQSLTLETWTHFGAGPRGTVTVQPGDYSCAPETLFCDYSFAKGTTVTNLASAPPGAVFQSWQDCNGSFLSPNPVFELVLNNNQCIQAYFINSPGPYSLTVYKGIPGLGNGSISGPAGVFCGVDSASCSYGGFPSGSIVTLTNTPAPGWSFAYWETNGVIYSNSGPLSLTLNGDTLVQAVFVQADKPPTVSIISPTNGALVWVCASSPVVAMASDPDGWVSQLEIFMDSTNGLKLGEQNFGAQPGGTPVFLTFNWKTDILGSTNWFIARATDNSGAQALSSPVGIITVLPPLHYLIPYGIAHQECELCMNGQTGQVYQVLAATNIETRLSNWENVGVMQGTNGLLKFFDPSVTNLPRRFYRALMR